MSKNRPKNLSSFPEKPKPKVQYRSTSSFPGMKNDPKKTETNRPGKTKTNPTKAETNPTKVLSLPKTTHILEDR